MIPILPPPPNNFKGITELGWAQLADRPPPFFHPRKYKGRRLQGVKYEDLVQKMLITGYANYVPGPWLRFSNGGKVQWCQPDGLLIDIRKGVCVIVEVKLQHTTDAWWQTRKLYEPVLGKILTEGLWTFRVLEIVKWYDAAVMWPEPVRLMAHPEDAFHLPLNATGVHLWKP